MLRERKLRRFARTTGRRCFRRWAAVAYLKRHLRARARFRAWADVVTTRRAVLQIFRRAYERSWSRTVLRAWRRAARLLASWRLALEREAQKHRRLCAAALKRWHVFWTLEKVARRFLRARGLAKRRTRLWARRALKAWRGAARDGRVAASLTPRRRPRPHATSRHFLDEDAVAAVHSPIAD